MNLSHASDLEAARSAASGNATAAAALVQSHYAALYAFLRRLVPCDADAADLTQRAFARVWQSLPGFAGRSSLRSWMHAVAWRTYVDWVRSDHRAEARPADWWDAVPAAEPDPSSQVADADLAAAVYSRVDQLVPELRVAIHLHYYQGLTLAETADALDLAVSTLKLRLRDAMEQIRLALRDPQPGTSMVAPSNSSLLYESPRPHA